MADNREFAPEMGTAASNTELLIDFSDEEKIPFPQQLMLTAEVDDTFGLFISKPRSASMPISNLSSGINGGDIFSPKMIPGHEFTDSVFEYTKSQGTPVRSMSTGKIENRKERIERKDSVLSTISNISSIRDSSASNVGLNEGFVESDLPEGSDTSRNSASTMGTDNGTRGDSTDKENSPRGIMEASPDKNDSQLLDLSGFTIYEDEPDEMRQKVKEEKPAVADTEPDIFARVLKRQSLMKQGNEAIAKKVQEMFDAASPSKNPQLFVSIPKFRTYTPARKPVNSEPFCYGTPKRQLPFPSGSALEGPNLSFTDSPLCSVQDQQQPLDANEPCTKQEEKRQEQIISHVIPTPIRNGAKPQESLKHLNIVKDSEMSRSNASIRLRLSFSSTSSESISEPVTSTREVKTAIIHPRIHPSIGFQAKSKISVSGQRRSGELKDLQPLKAVHSVAPHKLASAPVYRKFPAPVATSSPIVSAHKIRPLETPPRHTKSSLARQNAGQRASMSPSAKSLNTSQSRIPQSPNYNFKPSLENNTRPMPKRKPLVLSSSDQPQARQSIATKRRSISHGSAEAGKTSNMSCGVRSNGIPEPHLRVKKIGIPKF